MTQLLKVLLLAPMLLLPGCASYQKGALPNAQVTSLYLEPIQNEAYLSGIAPLFQSELRKQILASRLLKLVDAPAQADKVAYIRLTDSVEQPIGFLETDTGQPISARIALSAVLRLSDTSHQPTSPPTEKTVRVESAVYSSPPTAFPNPVNQSKPAIARSLAEKMVLELELARP